MRRRRPTVRCVAVSAIGRRGVCWGGTLSVELELTTRRSCPGHGARPPEHALNNLLQNSYFQPTDLAEIATQLDDEENATLDEDRKSSENMDDSCVPLASQRPSSPIGSSER